jgi:hypothetical protein
MLYRLLGFAAGEKHKDEGAGERYDLLLHAGRIAGRYGLGVNSQ